MAIFDKKDNFLTENTCLIQINGPRNMEKGLKQPVKYPLRNARC